MDLETCEPSLQPHLDTEIVSTDESDSLFHGQAGQGGIIETAVRLSGVCRCCEQNLGRGRCTPRAPCHAPHPARSVLLGARHGLGRNTASSFKGVSE